MTEFTNKENQFKSILEEMEFELDTNEIYGAIESRLPKKNRKRFGFLWLFAGLLLATIATVTYSQFYDLKDNADQFFSSDENMYLITDQNSTNKPNEVLVYANTINASKKEVFSIGEKTSNAETSQFNDRSLFVQDNIKNDLFNVASAPISTLNSVNVSGQNVQDPIFGSTELKSTDNNLSSYDLSVNTAMGSRSEIVLLDQIKVLGVANINNKAITQSLTIPLTNRPVWHLSMSLLSGLNQTILDDELMSSLDSREAFDLESAKLGVNSAFRVTMNHVSGWKFFSQIAYQSQVVRFRNFNLSSDTETIGADIPVINVQGEYGTEQGTLSRTTISIHNLQQHRRHQYINLHLGLAKSLVSEGLFSLDAEASILYNLSSKHSGYYINNEGNFITIEKDQSNYKSSTGLAYNIGTTLGLNINKYSIGINPFYQARVGNITTAQNFMRKDAVFGVNLKLSYLIN